MRCPFTCAMLQATSPRLPVACPWHPCCSLSCGGIRLLLLEVNELCMEQQEQGLHIPKNIPTGSAAARSTFLRFQQFQEELAGTAPARDTVRSAPVLAGNFWQGCAQTLPFAFPRSMRTIGSMVPCLNHCRALRATELPVTFPRAVHNLAVWASGFSRLGPSSSSVFPAGACARSAPSLYFSTCQKGW